MTYILRPFKPEYTSNNTVKPKEPAPTRAPPQTKEKKMNDAIRTMAPAFLLALTMLLGNPTVASAQKEKRCRAIALVLRLARKESTDPSKLQILHRLKTKYCSNKAHLTKIYTSRQQALSNPSLVRRLDLSHKGLSSFPTWISGLTNLEELNLSHNKLKHIHPHIAYVKKLRFLNLSHNKIKDIHPHISYLKNLRTLLLSHNRIKDIHPHISYVKKLRVLDLSHNRLKHVHPHINYLRQLRGLDLSHNKILHFPSHVLSLPALRHLNVRKNPMKHIPQRAKRLQRGSMRWRR